VKKALGAGDRVHILAPGYLTLLLQKGAGMDPGKPFHAWFLMSVDG